MIIGLLSGLRSQPKLGVSRCPPASEDLSISAPALTFLLQLAGPTCNPVNRWAGAVLKGAGRGRSRALLTNYRRVGGAKARD